MSFHFVSRGIAVSLLLPSLLLSFGCDNHGGRQAVSGMVTLKGKPLDDGTITFLPASREGTTQSGTGITNGRYEIPRDKGLVPGKYRVSISSPDGKTPDASSDALPGPSGNFASKDRIPARYNLESSLTVEVTSTGPNKFDYDIP